jgi:hypothetical protein
MVVIFLLETCRGFSWIIKAFQGQHCIKETIVPNKVTAVFLQANLDLGKTKHAVILLYEYLCVQGRNKDTRGVL